MSKFVNNVKSAMLLGLLMGLILLVGAQFGQQGLIMAFLLGGMTNVIAYFFSDKIALAAMRGQAVDRHTAPDLIHMIERLAENAALPMPKVYVVSPNRRRTLLPPVGALGRRLWR